MALNNELSAGIHAGRTQAGGALWIVSLPLLAALYVYVNTLLAGQEALLDGDTYSHIAIGRWIIDNGAVPTQDHFSHTMKGAPWTAFEWLSQVVLAVVHAAWGWTGLVAVTAVAFAATVALLSRALLRHFEPIHVLLFTGLAIGMTTGHALARPHMLAMPLMLAWVIELVRAADDRRSPALWMLPLMTLWANLHGSFTLGLAFTCVFAAESVLAARAGGRMQPVARAWGIFLALAVLASLLTPHGLRGAEVTWQVLFQDQYALGRIGEWRSPNFHTPQPLELWLLGAFAVALHQGLRLPAIRLLLVLGLIHLSLKHIRYVELLGLLGPLIVAQPIAAQWRLRREGRAQFQAADQFFAKLARPAGHGALAACAAMALGTTLWMANARPHTPPASIAPVAAIKAARDLGIRGPVLNGYEWGGYLIHTGHPVFIDGRSDMYRDAFIREYVTALELHDKVALEKLLEKYKVAWSILPAQVSANAMLDRLPGWRRVYEDKFAIVHVRTSAIPGSTNAPNAPNAPNQGTAP